MEICRKEVKQCAGGTAGLVARHTYPRDYRRKEAEGTREDHAIKGAHSGFIGGIAKSLRD
jgi:hypothetical protein